MEVSKLEEDAGKLLTRLEDKNDSVRYHVWKLNDRKTAFFKVTSFTHSHYADIRVPASFKTRQQGYWLMKRDNLWGMVLKCHGCSVCRARLDWAELGWTKLERN